MFLGHCVAHISRSRGEPVKVPKHVGQCVEQLAVVRPRALPSATACLFAIRYIRVLSQANCLPQHIALHHMANGHNTSNA